MENCNCLACECGNKEGCLHKIATVSDSPVLDGSIAAQATLEAGCELYCRWYDTGNPQMSGKDIAYEMVSFMRRALAELKST